MPYSRGQYYLPGMRGAANPFAIGYQPPAVPVGPTSAPPAPWFVWNGTGWYEDPNLRQQYEEQQQAEKLLPLAADLQKSRERNMVDVGLAGARLAADWETGGRDLAFRAAESDAERRMREWMQRRDMAARSQELAQGRAHEIAMSAMADQQARGRMGLASQYDLERLYADQAFRADEAAAARQQQADLAVLGSDLGLRNLGVQSELTGRRDRALADMEIERLARANELARQTMQDQQRFQTERDLFARDAAVADAYRNRGWSREDAATHQGYRMDELGAQFGQQRAMAGLTDEMYRGRDAQEYVLNDAKATKLRLMQMMPLLDANGRRRAEELLRQHARIGELGLRGDGLSQALGQWMGKVSGEDLQFRKKPSPLEAYQTETFLDPETGKRLQRDEKGAFSEVFKPVKPSPSDKMSGKPLSAVGRFWSNEDGGKWREGRIKDVMDRHSKANPDKPMSYAEAFDEASKQAEAVDRMIAIRQQQETEKRAAPIREMLREYAEAQFSGRPSKYSGLESQIREAAESSGIDVDEMYRTELAKAADKSLDEHPIEPRPTAKMKVPSDPVDPARDVGMAALQQGGVNEVEVANRQGEVFYVARSAEQARMLQKVLPSGGPRILVINERNQEYPIGGLGPTPTAPVARPRYILPLEPSQLGNPGY